VRKKIHKRLQRRYKNIKIEVLYSSEFNLSMIRQSIVNTMERNIIFMRHSSNKNIFSIN